MASDTPGLARGAAENSKAESAEDGSAPYDRSPPACIMGLAVDQIKDANDWHVSECVRVHILLQVVDNVTRTTPSTRRNQNGTLTTQLRGNRKDFCQRPGCSHMPTTVQISAIKRLNIPKRFFNVPTWWNGNIVSSSLLEKGRQFQKRTITLNRVLHIETLKFETFSNFGRVRPQPKRESNSARVEALRNESKVPAQINLGRENPQARFTLEIREVKICNVLNFVSTGFMTPNGLKRRKPVMAIITQPRLVTLTNCFIQLVPKVFKDSLL